MSDKNNTICPDCAVCAFTLEVKICKGCGNSSDLDYDTIEYCTKCAVKLNVCRGCGNSLIKSGATSRKRLREKLGVLLKTVNPEIEDSKLTMLVDKLEEMFSAYVSAPNGMKDQAYEEKEKDFLEIARR